MNYVKWSLLNQEKQALNSLIRNQNVKNYINDTDKNLGTISVDKSDVIKECQLQLHDFFLYKKVLLEEAKLLIKKIKLDLKNIVRKHIENGSFSCKEVKFILSKINSFSIPHSCHLEYFERPICRKTNRSWIQLNSYICIYFRGFFFVLFYSKFDGILKDSLNLIKILQKTKFNKNCFFV